MKFFVVDAFSEKLFKGNPAGVCLLEDELSDETMQNIAFENNLAETAFLLSKENTYYLRWFTPEVEIDLCGHATLATAYILMNFIQKDLKEISFETKSGTLKVVCEKDIYSMNFPCRMSQPVEKHPLLEKALGCRVMETYLSRDLIAVVESESDVKNLNIDFNLIREICKETVFAVIVTAIGESCDFVSRFFAPNAGILEDPVTGSSHSALIPYWNKRLKKTKMVAKQLSSRGGTLLCEYCGDRVNIGGKAVCYLEGTIKI